MKKLPKWAVIVVGAIAVIAVVVLIFVGVQVYKDIKDKQRDETDTEIVDNMMDFYTQCTVDDIKDSSVSALVDKYIQQGGVSKFIANDVMYVVIAFNGIETTIKEDPDRQLYIEYRQAGTDADYAIYKCNTDKVWVNNREAMGAVEGILIYTEGNIAHIFAPEYGHLAVPTYRTFENGAYSFTLTSSGVQGAEMIDSIITTVMPCTDEVLYTGFNLNGRFPIPNFKIQDLTERFLVEFYYDDGVQVRRLINEAL